MLYKLGYKIGAFIGKFINLARDFKEGFIQVFLPF